MRAGRAAEIQLLHNLLVYDHCGVDASCANALHLALKALPLNLNSTLRSDVLHRYAELKPPTLNSG